MKKIMNLSIAVTACLAFSGSVIAADKLEVASTFATSNLLGQMGVKFADNVNIATGGDVKLKLHEPGDLVPTLEVFDAVSSGAIDAGWDWMGYWSSVVPVAQFYGGLPFGPTSEVSASWMWNGGGLEIIQREYAKHNVMVLPCFIEPQETAGWYREEITGPESYDGMKIRMSGLGAKVLTKLGASTQLVPGSETYLALERGRVDAADFAIPTVDEALGFYEIAKYNYFPGWHQSASWFSFLINKDVWDGYSDQRRAQFEMACQATIQYTFNRLPAEQAEVIDRMAAKGAITKRLPDSVMKRLKTAWDEVLEEEMKKPVVKEMYESLQAHQAKINKWNELQRLQ
jgi:TRAP-type mannitol/chloroaromatic compound transport system substrate-binding protein